MTTTETPTTDHRAHTLPNDAAKRYWTAVFGPYVTSAEQAIAEFSIPTESEESITIWLANAADKAREQGAKVPDTDDAWSAVVALLVLAKVSQAAEQAGAEDYECRRRDVSQGAEAEDWAWPFTGADDAYLNAVGTGKVCDDLGIPRESWDDVSSEWLAAFRRGYEGAHEE
jgi:hypothetical protein